MAGSGLRREDAVAAARHEDASARAGGQKLPPEARELRRAPGQRRQHGGLPAHVGEHGPRHRFVRGHEANSRSNCSTRRPRTGAILPQSTVCSLATSAGVEGV